MDTAEAKKTILAKCKDWKKAGIKTVVCNYSGSGDEGDITDFEINDGEQHDLPDLKSGPIYDAFESLTFANVCYDGDGGGGSITVDVTAKTITRTEFYYETVSTDAGTETL